MCTEKRTVVRRSIGLLRRSKALFLARSAGFRARTEFRVYQHMKFNSF
jgi:hypothetical protein